MTGLHNTLVDVYYGTSKGDYWVVDAHLEKVIKQSLKIQPILSQADGENPR